jgi:flagellar biosynthetic protein FlhB
MRMLKDALKNVVKLAAYVTVAWLLIRSIIAAPKLGSNDAQGLALAMQAAGLRLVLLFLLLALVFLAIDQIIVRREYLKQMRMSRRELTREFKEREGEPRIKQKRKQLHAEFAKQGNQMRALPGSDMLIVNPQHVAVALAYDPARMGAPRVSLKARNNWALAAKREAFRLGIPIFEDRALARRLHDECDAGAEIRETHFRAVADLYLKLQASRPGTADARPVSQ